MQDSYYEEYLPMALECGMSPTQFWEGEPRLLNSYIRKHELELDEYNYKSWLSNFYNYKATLSAILQVFGDRTKLKDEDIQYFKSPLDEFNINKTSLNKEEKKEIIDNTHRTRVNFWAKFKKKGGK